MGDVQRVVSSIWTEFLCVDRVEPDEDFFELGGHSLLGIQVVARLSHRFGVELPLEALLERPTVRELAEAIEDLLEGGSPGYRGPTPSLRSPAQSLSFAQERLWFLERLTPGNPAFNVPMGIRLSGLLDVRRLCEGLERIVPRHEILRASFVEVEGRPMQRVASHVEFGVESTDLSHLPRDVAEAELERISTEHGLLSFDLDRAPLMRARVVRLGPEEHVLLIALHHIVADAWSLRVLAGELTGSYRAATIPELPLQYSDFAEWQRERFQGGVIEPQLAYWLGELSGPLPALELPRAGKHGPEGSGSGGAHRLELGAALSDQLKRFARQRAVTPFMVLLAAFVLLLKRYTGQDDVVVGVPVAGRSWVELEPLIGFFVNTLPMRVRLAATPTFEHVVRQVRDVASGAFVHQDLPYERLIAALSLERDLTRAALVSVLFHVHEDSVFPPWTFPEWRWRSCPHAAARQRATTSK